LVANLFDCQYRQVVKPPFFVEHKMTNTQDSMTIMQKQKEMFQIGIDLAEKIIEKAPNLSGDVDEVLYQAVMHYYFFGKAYKTLQAVRLLCKNGYGQDAEILSRSIYELALQASYMAQDPKNRARLWINHDRVVRYNFYKGLKKSGNIDTAEKIESEKAKFAELERCYHKYRSDYRPSENCWWGNTIKWLAEQVSKEISYWHGAIYPMQSDLVHSGVASVNRYLSGNEHCATMDCRPAVPVSSMAVVFPALHFYRLMLVDIEALNLESELEEHIQKFDENFPRLRDELVEYDT
jgi:hypothetical protein